MTEFKSMMGRRSDVIATDGNWRSRGLQLLMAGLPLAILATGCGATVPLHVAAVATPDQVVETPVTVDACWTDDQRVEGDDTMPQQYTQAPAMRIDPAKTYTGVLQTNKGPIEVELFPQDAPITVNNFVCLAEDGYFDNTPFHRIVKGFVIQGGDPTGTGSGGPGYKFADESITKDYERGTLAMANAGPDTNGSQFFVVLDDLRGKLPKNYTIFGRVTAGMDVVDAIANTPTRTGRSGENSTPTEPVTLEKVMISNSES
jgi:cyclophilin family peptidyl-prolyl cis-trans isomerase